MSVVLEHQWDALSLVVHVDPADVSLLQVPPSDCFTVVAMVDGSCRIESRGARGWSSAIYTAGDVGMTAPGRSVDLRWTGLTPRQLRTVHISLPLSHFHRFASEEACDGVLDLERFDVLSTPDPLVFSMAQSLVRARETGAGELYAESAAQFLVGHVLQPKPETAPDRGGLTERQLTTVLDRMRSDLPSHLTLDDLASEVSLSRFHFLRMFTASTGKSPFQYLTGLRMSAARRLLASTDEPVSKIGREVGLHNASHFTATFTQHVGCSPSSYRQHARG